MRSRKRERNSTALPTKRLLLRIGITIGDPSGIGPEVVLKALDSARLPPSCRLVVIGDAGLLERQAERLGAGTWGLRRSEILDLANLPPRFTPQGRPSAQSGRAAAAYVFEAARRCLAGELDAMVTAPISKRALALAGLSYAGHTELLAELAGAKDFAMAFFTRRPRKTLGPFWIVLCTTHLPLREAIASIDKKRVSRIIRLAWRELGALGYDRRIAVAGINPHAGEEGLLGREESEKLAPAVTECRKAGIEVAGPFPADTLFVRAARGEFDAVLAMYHDQGLIAAKLFGLGRAVNVTLGLPFIRTSVDHGTAHDIAGKGIADPSSMIEAIRLAAELARRRASRRTD